MSTNVVTIPSSFTVVIDPGQLQPWSFAGLRAGSVYAGATVEVRSERRAVPHGDYTIRGHEKRVGIERQTVANLYGLFERHQDRVWQRWQGCAEMTFYAVIVEGTWAAIGRPVEHGVDSGVEPRAIVASMCAAMHRMAWVRWLTADSPVIAGNLCYRLLERYWLDYHDDQPRWAPPPRRSGDTGVADPSRGSRSAPPG